MRILVCNHRYFVSGGPERYMFEVMDLLESRGHSVVPFSIGYDRNLPTPYSKYFVSPPVSGRHVYFEDTRLGLADKARLAARTIYNSEARRKVAEAVRGERIDLVYTLQAVNFLYAGVVDGAADAGVPVAARMSDFQLMCPAYTFFRDSRVCEDCREGLLHAVWNRCLQGSAAVSAVRVAAMALQRIMKTSDRVAGFITPSRFLRQKMVEYGFAPEKVHWVPTFKDLSRYEPDYTPGGYVLYAGTVRRYKGLEVLLRAFGRLGGEAMLKVAGIISEAERGRIERLIKDEGIRGVEFTGYKEGAELAALYRGAAFVVVPSIWYENMPNTALEAMASGKAVVASDLGSLPETVSDGETGLLFAAGDVEGLAGKMGWLLARPEEAERMGRAGRMKVEVEHSPELHYERLIGLFEKMVGEKAQR